jgi:NAD-specific glutamate dehydrogenase
MAAELVDRLAILVAARRFHGMCASDSRSLRSDIYARMQHFVRRTTYVPFRRFLGDVRREFMQRLADALHGTLDSYLPEVLQEGSADAVACCVNLFAWWYIRCIFL